MWAFLQTLALLTLVYIVLLWILRRLRVRNYDQKYVFITGCDSGFGNLLTKRLDKLGFHVFAGCLTKDGAMDINGNCSKNVHTVQVDVTDEASVKDAREWVEKRLPRNTGLWGIVNNAGIAGGIGPIDWASTKDIRQTIEVDLFGVIWVTKAFMSLVYKHEPGRIINMASSMGRFAGATGGYCAAKFGVEGFSDVLRREVLLAGVSVHIIEPGYFSTGIVSEGTVYSGLASSFEHAPPDVRKFYGSSYRDELSTHSTKFLSIVLSPNVNKVVDAYEHSLTARYPKARYVVGWDANLYFRLLWNLPERVMDYILTRDQPIPEGVIERQKRLRR